MRSPIWQESVNSEYETGGMNVNQRGRWPQSATARSI